MYLLDKDEAVQFEYWLTGTEDYITKFVPTCIHQMTR